MNTHKNARLTFLRRLEMVQDVTERGLAVSEAAAKQGVSAVTARKWLGRYLADGAQALADKSSRPARSPRSIDPGVAATIVELRRKLFLQANIASYMGVSKATVSRVLKRAGLSRLSDLRPVEAVQRYEREAPGELLHIDIKKLGRFDAEAIASRAIAANAPGTQAGTMSSWQWMTIAAWHSPRSIRTNARRAPRASCTRLCGTLLRWAYQCSG